MSVTQVLKQGINIKTIRNNYMLQFQKHKIAFIVSLDVSVRIEVL